MTRSRALNKQGAKDLEQSPYNSIGLLAFRINLIVASLHYEARVSVLHVSFGTVRMRSYIVVRLTEVEEQCLKADRSQVLWVVSPLRSLV